MFTQGEWREHTDENGDVWVLVGDARPGAMHAYHIGNLEDTCGECHGNADLMINAPKMYYAALKHIAEYANTCNTMTPAAGYRRIIKLAERAVSALDMPSEKSTWKLDLSLPEAAGGVAECIDRQ